MRPITIAPMIDQTGLPEVYEITLKTGEPLTDFMDWAAALDGQLGLKLEERKVPTQILTIDSAVRPTAN
jgi:uncharacterized protein (TIGR03435 family)